MKWAHQLCSFERTWTLRRPIFNISFVEFWSRLTYSVWEFSHYILRQTEWIQLLAWFVGWILSRFYNRRGLWRCYRCCLSCFLLFRQRASATTFDHLFVRLPSLCLEFCLSFVIILSKHFSAVHSIVIVWAGYIRLLFKLPFKFRNVLQHTERRSFFACNQNIKEDSASSIPERTGYK